MQIDIFTLFPGMFDGPLTESILKRAQEMGAVSFELHDIRDFTTDKHRMADDTPYGGQGGMIMKPEPIVSAIESTLDEEVPVILMSPQGDVFSQDIAFELAQLDQFALLCGHYEGVDERVRDLVVTREISLGDYVLTGGELAAMVIIDAVVRLLPGVLGDPSAPLKDSHATGLLEHPHYTRPPEFRGLKVPDVLLSGHEANIITWRRLESIRRTWERRPELLLEVELTDAESYFLASLARASIERILK